MDEPTKRPKKKLIRDLPGDTPLETAGPKKPINNNPITDATEGVLVQADTFKAIIVKLGVTLAATKTQLEHLVGDMKSINVNIHPIKWGTKASWERTLENIIKTIHAEVNNVPQLYPTEEQKAS